MPVDVPAAVQARIAELEAQVLHLRRMLTLETSRAQTMAAVTAGMNAARLSRAAMAGTEKQCAYGAVCVDVADLLVLLAALPSPSPDAIPAG